MFIAGLFLIISSTLQPNRHERVSYSQSAGEEGLHGPTSPLAVDQTGMASLRFKLLAPTGLCYKSVIIDEGEGIVNELGQEGSVTLV